MGVGCGKTAPPGVGPRSQAADELRLGGAGVVLVLLVWLLQGLIGVWVLGEASLRQVLARSLHDLALLLLLAGGFLYFSRRVVRQRSALEQALTKALARAEAERGKVASIIEAIADPISIQDTELKILYQNRSHQDLVGRHLGERCYLAYHQEPQVCRDCHLVASFQDRAVHRREVSMTLHGALRCMEISASPLFDPQGTVVAGIEVMRDITERKLAECAAQREADLLQLLIDTIPNPIYYQDLSGRLLGCNSAFALWLDRPREQILGQSLGDVAPAELSLMLRQRDLELIAGGGTQLFEATLKGADGKPRDLIFNRALYSERAAGRSGLVGVMIDITARKKAEVEILELNAELMRQAQDLQAANRELESFSSAVSHDLRAPLTRIYCSSQGLLEYKDLLDPDGAFFVQAINDGCIQMEALIEALLVLSRVTEVEMSKSPVDLSLMAEELGLKFSLQEPQRRVSFRVAAGLTALGDPQLLYVALENLIGNAWKYTGNCPLAQIEFGAQAGEGGETVFYLKDNGAGFDMGQAGSLFKPFHRLHQTEFPGTGVGLATVQRIVSRHQGRVWGVGQVGCGATFYFTLRGARS